MDLVYQSNRRKYLPGYAAWEIPPGDETGRDPMKYWEIIADNLSKAGWSWGWVSTINSDGQTIFVVDAHRRRRKALHRPRRGKAQRVC